MLLKAWLTTHWPSLKFSFWIRRNTVQEMNRSFPVVKHVHHTPSDSFHHCFILLLSSRWLLGSYLSIRSYHCSNPLLLNAEDAQCLFGATLGATSNHTFLGSSLSLCMYLVYRLFTLFVLLCLFFHFFPLFQFIDELKQVSQVQNYRFSL